MSEEPSFNSPMSDMFRKYSDDEPQSMPVDDTPIPVTEPEDDYESPIGWIIDKYSEPEPTPEFVSPMDSIISRIEDTEPAGPIELPEDPVVRDIVSENLPPASSPAPPNSEPPQPIVDVQPESKPEEDIDWKDYLSMWSPLKTLWERSIKPGFGSMARGIVQESIDELPGQVSEFITGGGPLPGPGDSVIPFVPSPKDMFAKFIPALTGDSLEDVIKDGVDEKLKLSEIRKLLEEPVFEDEKIEQEIRVAEMEAAWASGDWKSILLTNMKHMGADMAPMLAVMAAMSKIKGLKSMKVSSVEKKAKIIKEFMNTLMTYKTFKTITPGSKEEKQLQGVLMAAYVQTAVAAGYVPQILGKGAGKTGNTIAIISDVLMNMGITASTGQYKQAIDRGKKLAKDAGKEGSEFYFILAELGPIIGMDAAFTIWTRDVRNQGNVTAHLTEEQTKKHQDAGRLPKDLVVRARMTPSGVMQKAVGEKPITAEPMPKTPADIEPSVLIRSITGEESVAKAPEGKTKPSVGKEPSEVIADQRRGIRPGESEQQFITRMASEGKRIPKDDPASTRDPVERETIERRTVEQEDVRAEIIDEIMEIDRLDERVIGPGVERRAELMSMSDADLIAEQRRLGIEPTESLLMMREKRTEEAPGDTVTPVLEAQVAKEVDKIRKLPSKTIENRARKLGVPEKLINKYKSAKGKAKADAKYKLAVAISQYADAAAKAEPPAKAVTESVPEPESTTISKTSEMPTERRTEPPPSERSGVKAENPDPAIQARDESLTRQPQNQDQYNKDHEIHKAHDIESEAKAEARVGALTLPTMKMFDNLGARIKAVLKRQWTRERGVDKILFGLAELNRKTKNLVSAKGNTFKRSARNFIRTEGKATGDRQQVLQDVHNTLHGDMSMKDFISKYDEPTNESGTRGTKKTEWLWKFHEERVASGKKLAEAMEESGVFPDALIQHVRDNEFYITRIYEKFVLGDDFTPLKEDVDQAIELVKADLLGAIEGKKVTDSEGREKKWPGLKQKINKSGIKPEDAIHFLESGDVTVLKDYPPEAQAALMELGKSYLKHKNLIDDLLIEGEVVVAKINSEALHDAAESIVDFYLDRQPSKGTGDGVGGMDPRSLSRRTLGEVFRRLYGEIADPVINGKNTAEVQGRLLSNLVFLNRIVAEGRDVWWSEMRSKKHGRTIRVPDNTRQWGALAGKYVTKETASIMHRNGFKVKEGGWLQGVAIDVFLEIQSTMRLMKLMNVRTITRNYTSAVLGFSMGSGDVFRKGWIKNFKHGHKIVHRIMRGDYDALKEMEELAELDVFSPRLSSTVMDLRAVLTTRTGAGKKVRKAVSDSIGTMGEQYAYLDFPTKYAAYKTMLDNGYSKADAAEHVRKFYQHAESVAPWVRSMSKTPLLGDYPGYIADSIRIQGNQIVHAIRSAQGGDVAPAFGFVISRTLSAMSTAVGVRILFEAFKSIKEALGGDDDMELVSPIVNGAMRSFQPRYYESTPQIIYQEGRGESKEIVVVIMAGQSAFPLDDMITGTLQSSLGQSTQDLGNAAWNNVVESGIIGPGMFPDLLWKTATGDELFGKFKSKGIVDVLGEEDPDTLEVVVKSLRNLGIESVVPYGSKIVQLADAKQAELEGIREPIAGAYSQHKNSADIARSMMEPVRVYRYDKKSLQRIIRSRLSDYRNGFASAKTNIAREARQVEHYGVSTKENKRKAARNQKWRRDKLKEIEGIAQNALALGFFSYDEVEAMIRDGAGLNKGEAEAVMNRSSQFIDDYEASNRMSALERVQSR